MHAWNFTHTIIEHTCLTVYNCERAKVFVACLIYLYIHSAMTYSLFCDFLPREEHASLTR